MSRRIIQAITALDVLGPMPTLPRRGPVRRRHQEADVWESKATEIGRAFFLAIWRDARGGDAVCRGYINATLFPNESRYDEQPITDAMIASYAETITPRWTESLRAMGGEP